MSRLLRRPIPATARRSGPPALAAAAAAFAACISPLPLEGRGCPCTDGYQCCASKNQCIPVSQECPASSGGAPRPDADASSVAPDAAPDVSAGISVVEASADAREAQVDAPVDRDADARKAEVSDALADAIEAGPLVVGSEASNAADAVTAPRWQTLGDLSANSVVFFDLQVAADGSPYLGLLSLVTPGRARNTNVLHYDGATWQKVGADLPSTEESSFALAPDGTPYIVVTTTIRSFQQGAWQQLPDFAPGVIVPVQFPAIAVDRSGRLNAIAFDTATGAMGVARFTGTAWEFLGARDSLGTARLPRALGFDANFAYVATNDNATSFQTDVRRFDGSTWQSIGGGTFSAINGAFAVSGSGTAYLAFANGASVNTEQTPPSPWQDRDFITAFTGGVQVPPAMDIAADDSLYLAYLGDRDPGPNVVPGPKVSRSNAGQVTDLPTDGLDPTVFGFIKVKVAQKAGRDVPYVGYVTGNSLVVKMFQ